MTVKQYPIRPTPGNPPLILGEVYRITSTQVLDSFVRPGQYFAVGPDGTVVYLGGMAQGWGRVSRLSELAANFVTVTLDESNV